MAVQRHTHLAVGAEKSCCPFTPVLIVSTLRLSTQSHFHLLDSYSRAPSLPLTPINQHVRHCTFTLPTNSTTSTDNRSDAPYDPYIPANSRGGPSSGAAGAQPGGNQKVSVLRCPAWSHHVCSRKASHCSSTTLSVLNDANLTRSVRSRRRLMIPSR